MIVFFGTSPRSAKFLDLAIKNGLRVDLVVSAPPKPIGKKQILTENPTVTAADNLKIPVLTSLNKITRYQDNKLTIGLILDYNKIIPNQIIDLFDKGIINIHFSRLPKYRGPAPVQYTILNGDKEAWITYYLIDEKTDTGKIITQTPLPLDQTETTQTLYEKLIAKAASETTQIIESYLSGKVQLYPQKGVTSDTQKLKTENCKIDWTKSPEKIDRLIRASYPEPVSWTSVQIPVSPAGGHFQSAKIQSEKRLKILKAHLENGKLVLDQVQLEGKKPVLWKQFKEGHPKAEFKQIKN